VIREKREEQTQHFEKMKGLFKSKPRTPADVVRHTRDLLLVVDRNSESRESKREEKVRLFPYF